MQTFLLLVLDLILAGIAYFLYVGLFVPIMKKNALYGKLKAKERDLLDQKLGMQEYFGLKVEETEKKK